MHDARHECIESTLQCAKDITFPSSDLVENTNSPQSSSTARYHGHLLSTKALHRSAVAHVASNIRNRHPALLLDDLVSRRQEPNSRRCGNLQRSPTPPPDCRSPHHRCYLARHRHVDPYFSPRQSCLGWICCFPWSLSGVGVG
ncbi:uncharacterized protein MYCFIDRAFT_214737 [Pseudocercospora fijiensis CIRAD86]|uniref:Uncharacterized protein n=1 Tax=Pseudocercospora fijiensis (strain CIRAD86) TaxID=383855 RepID=M3AIL3_PSEFD|nr:uncharacterized protein MYCFIDRAFT_214737 [Pseudocercospora fijiensis CIRAD86]EME84436.1 hypothetical protein MYCFIDRAFT_214737 [Pseudocercospora fijiensis CIRAD86]